jgi:putative Mn2+ efflux pump MntP
MDIVTILFIAIGLSMDALAVSIAHGFAMKRLRLNKAIRMALFFGFFQMLMPIVGWFCGVGFKKIISGFDHWVAFLLLTLIGIKMIYESTKLKEEDERKSDVGIYLLLMLSIATSIDALAVGLSLSLLKVAIVMPAVIIGVITFSLSLAGVAAGSRFGHFFENKIEMLGGAILICIGLKILLQHIL